MTDYQLLSGLGDSSQVGACALVNRTSREDIILMNVG